MTPSALAEFDRHRKRVDTASGPAAYVDVGEGPPALFVHGVGTSGLLWRRVVERLAAPRRCIAVALPAPGGTPARDDQDLTLGGLARFVADVRDALGLEQVDLVANDTGGGVAQIVAGPGTRAAAQPDAD